MTRRDLLKLTAMAPASALAASPAFDSAVVRRVAIARCRSYDTSAEALKSLFDNLGGLSPIVANKTVTIKLNLTGNPDARLRGLPLGQTHYVHPRLALALTRLMGEAGARRIRFVESCWAWSGALEDYLLNSGWNVRALQAAATRVEFENTNALGSAKTYARLRVPGPAYLFPAFDLNHSYEDTDVFVSLAKLKEHETCGVTLSLKNCFGNTPASIYGDDAGIHEPNELPRSGRVKAMHEGKRRPALSAPQEIDRASSREPGYRMPRIVVDVCSARPVDLAIIDGVFTMCGGEGPWVKSVAPIAPGVLIAGTNAVNTDAVATAVMGFDPRAARDKAPFHGCDNTLLLAESHGLGSADLRKIEIAGLALPQAVFPFPSSPTNRGG
jgi:uncharacterized protein (DUF362 family)